MPVLFEVSSYNELNCALHSDLDAERRRGRNTNWRRLDELRFEFSEPPRSIEVAVHPPSSVLLGISSPQALCCPLGLCKILRDRALATTYILVFDLLLSRAS